MTQEEKAKAYDEASKVIKDNLDALNEITETGAETVNIQVIKNCFYRAFPELAESEDERIKKEIVRFIRMEVEDEIVGNKWLAWLEKQGEQKPFDYEHATITQKDFASKQEPKIDARENLTLDGDLMEAESMIIEPAWSEEDEKRIKKVIHILSLDGRISNEELKSIIDWLKSLRERLI